MAMKMISYDELRAHGVTSIRLEIGDCLSCSFGMYDILLCLEHSRTWNSST